LRTVAVHRPGIEMFFGLLEPYAALYERAFSRYEARREHERLESTLREDFGVEVVRLKESIVDAADRNPDVRRRLVDWAYSAATIRGGNRAAAEARRSMGENAENLDSQHFFTLLLLNPVIEVKRNHGTVGANVHILEQQPLANLYFMRDQQAMTDRGLVVARMAKPQRRREPAITKFLWEVLDVPIACEVREPGTFEGGDFIPMRDFALLGIGDRTNRAGIDQLLASALGFDEVGVVHQPTHPLIPSESPDPMVDMHLDTYVNVASSGVVLGSEILLRRAQVEVYQRTSQGYEPAGEMTSLHEYIREKGFEIIDLSTLEQISYAANILCIRDGTILTVEGERVMKTVLENLTQKAGYDLKRYGRLLDQARHDYRRIKENGQFFPHKKELYQHDLEIYPLRLENLTGGYGGPHCMTCALERG
jgi:arginine deiminase